MSWKLISPASPPALDVVLQAIVKVPAELAIPAIELTNIDSSQEQFALPGFEISPNPNQPCEFFVFEMFA